MAKEKPESGQQPRAPAPKTRTAAAAKTRTGGAADMLYCRCGHPMHPDHLEEHHGMMLERYACPRRRWWNALWHPRAWLEPREGVS